MRSSRRRVLRILSPFAKLMWEFSTNIFWISTNPATIQPQNTHSVFDFSLGLIGDLISKLQIDTRLLSKLIVVLIGKKSQIFSRNHKTHTLLSACHTPKKFSSKIPDINFANGDTVK